MSRCAWLVVLVFGCGGGGKQLPRTQVTEPGEALFNGYANPAIKCYECHDGSGGGTKWGPALAQRVPKLTDDQLRAVILDGKRKMPAHRGKLSDAELGQLAPWLRHRFDPARAP